VILDYLLVSVERLSMRTEGSPASNRARKKGGEEIRSFGDQAEVTKEEVLLLLSRLALSSSE